MVSMFDQVFVVLILEWILLHSEMEGHTVEREGRDVGFCLGGLCALFVTVFDKGAFPILCSRERFPRGSLQRVDVISTDLVAESSHLAGLADSFVEKKKALSQMSRDVLFVLLTFRIKRMCAHEVILRTHMYTHTHRSVSGCSTMFGT